MVGGRQMPDLEISALVSPDALGHPDDPLADDGARRIEGLPEQSEGLGASAVFIGDVAADARVSAAFALGRPSSLNQ